MLIEPGIEVNDIKDQSPAQPDWGRPDLGQEGDSDAQIGRRLFPRETARMG